MCWPDTMSEDAASQYCHKAKKTNQNSCRTGMRLHVPVKISQRCDWSSLSITPRPFQHTNKTMPSEHSRANPPPQPQKSCRATQAHRRGYSCPSLWVKTLLDLSALATDPHTVAKPRCFVTNPPLDILQSPHSRVCRVVTVGSFFRY